MSFITLYSIIYNSIVYKSILNAGLFHPALQNLSIPHPAIINYNSISQNISLFLQLSLKYKTIFDTAMRRISPIAERRQKRAVQGKQAPSTGVYFYK